MPTVVCLFVSGVRSGPPFEWLTNVCNFRQLTLQVSTTPITNSEVDLIPGKLWLTTTVSTQGLVELGVLFVGVAAQVPLWCIAYGLTKLPLLREVI